MNTQTSLMTIQEIQVSYKPKFQAEDAAITTSRRAHEIIKPFYPLSTIQYQESFFALYLSRSNRPIGVRHISSGGKSGTVADPSQILGVALKTNASGIIISHNHPSGSLKPSEADKRLTKKVAEGAKILDLVFVDHIIVTKDSYYSFADEGLL